MPKNDIKLEPEFFNKLQEVKTQKEDLDPKTQEAIESLDFANQIINSVSNGKQIDMAFFKAMQERIIKKLQHETTEKVSGKKKVIKTKKVYK